MKSVLASEQLKERQKVELQTQNDPSSVVVAAEHVVESVYVLQAPINTQPLPLVVHKFHNVLQSECVYKE